MAWRARTLVNATGTWTRPFWPWYPGRETFAGEQLHTHDFGRAEDFRGRRVVVVGGGTSAVQLLLQIAPHAASTTWVTRREPSWVGARSTRTGDGTRSRSWTSARVRPCAAERRVGHGPAAHARVRGGHRLGRAAPAPDVLAHRARRRRLGCGVRPDGVTHQGADVILWATGSGPRSTTWVRWDCAGRAAGSSWTGRPWSPTRGSSSSGTGRARRRSGRTGPP
ncbi:NAD(P)-binding domain-containing protein [Oerskovia sp. M15]